MKICILAFDGLEYDLVEKWNLEYIKQKQYGKTSIPKECYLVNAEFGKQAIEPWTPYVFASILTGKLPNNVGLNTLSRMQWNNPLLEIGKKVLNKLGVPLWARKRGRIANSLGFEKHWFMVNRDKTFLRNAEQVKIVEFPMLSQNWTIYSKEKEPTIEGMVDAAWKDWSRFKKDTFAALDADWNVLLSYTQLLDRIGELEYTKDSLRHAYFVVDHFIKTVKAILPPSTLLLILSDHGIEHWFKQFGKHSNHGFYSVNIQTDWEIKSILDFHHYLSQLINFKFFGELNFSE